MINRKAAGPLGILIELVKCGSDFSKDWETAFISSAHNKESERIYSNNRGIMVTISVERLHGRGKNRKYFLIIEKQTISRWTILYG